MSMSEAFNFAKSLKSQKFYMVMGPNFWVFEFFKMNEACCFDLVICGKVIKDKKK